MKKILIAIVIMLFALTGCFTQEKVTKKVLSTEENLNNVTVSKEFEFVPQAVVTTKAFSISAESLNGEEFAVYADGDTNAQPLLEGIFTDAVEYTLDVPVFIDAKSVTVVSKSGAFDNITTEIIDNKVSFSCKRTNVSTSIKRTDKSTSVVTPERWKCLEVIGTLAFEDKWPATGDYDFNDVVINYAAYKLVNVFNGKICGIVYNFSPAASGADLENGFGIELNIDKVTSSTILDAFLQKNLFTPVDFTYEASTKPVFIFTNNIKTFFKGYDSQVKIYNTEKNGQYYKGDIYTFVALFKTGIEYGKFNYKSINPFITVNGDREKEVHLKGFAPTVRADQTLFGTEDDNTDVSAKQYYMTKGENSPWALDIPCKWYYPVEKTAINTAYPQFMDWVKSEGRNSKEWYKRPDINKIY